MSNKMITEYDNNTKETITREMTDSEQAQHDAIIAESAAALIEAENNKVARKAILDRLGITEDEAKLLLG
jgi:hypothetical protein